MIAISYSKNEFIKFIFIVLILLIYVIGQYWTSLNDHLSIHSFDNITNLVLLVIFFIGAIILILDITTRTRKSDEKISQLLNELKIRNEELQQSNEKLESFSYLVSHDLKAPLNSIQSFSSLIQRKTKSGENHLSKYFQVIETNISQMKQMISDSLDKSLVGANLKEKAKVINLEELLTNLKLILFANYSNLNIESNPLPEIFSVYSDVYKIFLNLLENGAKYNEQSKKELNVSFSKSEKFIHFTFEDNGIGIPSNQLGNIFDERFRLNHTKYEGTGLGLAITKEAIKDLKGDIDVSSELGKGSKFILSLPIDILIENQKLSMDVA